MGHKVIADGQNSQGTAAIAGGKGVEFRRLHLDPKDPVAHHLVVQIRPLVVKDIRRVNPADMDFDALFQGGDCCGLQKSKVSTGREIQLFEYSP